MDQRLFRCSEKGQMCCWGQDLRTGSSELFIPTRFDRKQPVQRWLPSNGQPTHSKYFWPRGRRVLLRDVCSYPHPVLGQQMRPVGADMISPIQSKRSTCSHRPAGREFSRSVWLSVSGQLDGPLIAGVRESTWFICLYRHACEPMTTLTLPYILVFQDENSVAPGDDLHIPGTE